MEFTALSYEQFCSHHFLRICIFNAAFLCSRHALDTDSKKWRLFADFLNDLAMFLELLLLPLYQDSSTVILCLTTSMKGIVGVAAGASRAAITQHHVSSITLMFTNYNLSKSISQQLCILAIFITFFHMLNIE